MNQNWQNRFIEHAKFISTHSKDPSTKIGVIAVNPETNNILSMGFNGFPRGIGDNEDRLNNRELKYRYVVHGEQNCIYNATLNGISLKGAWMFVHGCTVCSECAKAIIQVGITRVFASYYGFNERWKESGLIAEDMFKEVGVMLTNIPLSVGDL